MPTVHLAEVLNGLGTNSVRELILRTGSPEPSLFKQAQIAAIDQFYQKHGGFQGPFGFPLGVEFQGPSGLGHFSGGKIGFLSDSPEGIEIMATRVRFVGFHCVQEAKWDGATDSDEPYFIIGVAGANGAKTVKFGPYEDVDGGERRSEATDVAGILDGITPPVVIGIIAMENDHGTPEEAEQKVRSAMESIINKLSQASGLLNSGVADSHVVPEWARDILVGWLAEGAVAVLGMGDEFIDHKHLLLFDHKADLKEWKVPPVEGTHEGNEYNVKIHVDGGDEGKYDLFFKVDLFKVDIKIQ